MVRSVVPPGEVVTSLLDDAIAVWLRSPGMSRTQIESAARPLLAPGGTSLPETHTIELRPDAQVALGRSTVEAVTAPVADLAESLSRRAPSEHWSASTRWLHDAAWYARMLVETGRAIPSIDAVGVRWMSTWRPLIDDDAAEVFDELLRSAPDAVFALTEDVRELVATQLIRRLVDAIGRRTLAQTGWRPELPRSRAASVMALRRATAALADTDSVFIAESLAHEATINSFAGQLATAAARAEGAPDVGFRARLTPPAAPDSAWRLDFDVITKAGESVAFGDLWNGTNAASSIGDTAALNRLRVRMRWMIDRLIDQNAVLARLATVADPTGTDLDVADVSTLLSDDSSAFDQLGIDLVSPIGAAPTSARLTMRASASDERRGLLGPTLVEVDWGVALGDVQLSREEIEELTRSQASVIALRGEWMTVDPRQMKALLSRFDERDRTSSTMSPTEFLRESIVELDDGEDDLSADGWISELLAGLPDDHLEEATEPAGFEGALRPYQRRALGWLQFLGRLGLGGCLADDMGLGKTPTALAHLLARSLDRVEHDVPHQPHLVICPLSVVTNWEAEASRFTPQLSVLVVHGPNRPRGENLARLAAEHDVVITTYGTASRIADELEPIDWDVVVCDEAQAIKNHLTNAAQAVRILGANQRIGLTGTPVENRLTELWAILDALNPGMLGGITWFRTRFANPIETHDDPDAREGLRRLTAPFVLRRTKADRTLVPDLPDKIEQIAWSTLSPEQAGLYQAVLDDFLERAAELGGIERRGLVLATLTKLKQICNHPAHFLGEADLGAANRSGKVARFDELVTDLIDAGERALVFTQYRVMGELLSAHVSERLEVATPFLHGGTTRQQRQAMIDSFQESDGPPIQFISLRAGGTGLNLTAATRVIHFDRWWNPAVEDQATDRSWRIGQTSTVFVHKMVCQGTLEERIDELLTRKRRIADSVVGTDESWLTELSTDELRALLQLDEATRASIDSWAVA
ncbi:MAG: DEAD/DEAH box helicase [Acidimicrobiales bacterium]